MKRSKSAERMRGKQIKEADMDEAEKRADKMRHAMCETLKKGRAELQLTQAQMAKLIGVKEGAYGNWEQGRLKPNIPKIHAAFPELADRIRRETMKYKPKSCSTCRYGCGMRWDEARSCNFLEMTGKSRVALGLVSTAPGRPCDAWEPRNKEESRRVNRVKVRMTFGMGYADGVLPPTVKVAEWGNVGGEEK